MHNLYVIDTVYKILIIAAVVLVFFIITIINLKTKKPDDCIEIDSSCSSCIQRCIHNKNKDLKKDE